MQRPSPRAADLLPHGELRVALFLPQYARDPASGALRGLGTGFIALEFAEVMAGRLGVPSCAIEYPSPPAAIAGLQSGASDMVFLGINPARTAQVAFTPPLFQFDYAFLLPPGSAIDSASAVDRPGMRIAVVEGHASATALQQIVRHAVLVGAALPDAAFDLFTGGAADAFALPRDHALDYCARFTGSRVLDEGYGVNRVGLAVASARNELHAYTMEFTAAAQTSGLVRDIIARGGLRGFVAAV